MTARLLYCTDCNLDTAHHQTRSGLWVCWCGHVDTAPDETERQAAEMAHDAEWMGMQ